MAVLPVLDQKGLSLDEIVIVAAEPSMAAKVNMPPVSLSLLDAVLNSVTDPDKRRALMVQPAPGFVRVAVFAGRDHMLLTMRVRGDASFAIPDVLPPSA